MTNFDQVKNDAASTLAAAYSPGAGSFVLASGAGANFPTPTATNPIRVVLMPAAKAYNPATLTPADMRIYQATGKSGDTLTGISAVEGYADDKSFAIGDAICMTATAATFTDIHTAINALENATTSASVAANQVYAGPTTGGAAAPTFRAQVAADVPALDAAKITTGTMATARLPSMVASGASHAAGIVPDPGAVAGTAKFLREDATWATPSGMSIGGTIGGTPLNGSILIVNASGQLAQDNANLFYDATNHRIGIGTNAPQAPVHAVGTGGACFYGTGASASTIQLYHDGFALVILAASPGRLNLQGFLFVESGSAYPQANNSFVLGASTAAYSSVWTRIVRADDAQAANTAGVDLALRGGASTGTGRGGAVRAQTTPAGGAGSTVNGFVDRSVLGDSRALTNAATSLFDVTLPAGARAGGVVHWTIEATDGTDHQSYSGLVNFAVVNKGGVYTTQVTQLAGVEAKAVSAGTLTATFAFLNGTNKVTLQVTPATSLTFTTFKMNFAVSHNSGQAITLL